MTKNETKKDVVPSLTYPRQPVVNGTTVESCVDKVCVGSTGRVGLVTHYESEHAYRCDRYVGIGFDGKGVWTSKSPAIVAESGEEFVRRLVDRFDGKLTYND